MSDWQEVVDPSTGTVYYYNPTTQETSWTNPAAPAAADSAWQEITDPSSGDKYYFNSITQETSWDRPASMGTAEAPAPKAASAPTGPSPRTPAAGPSLLPARTSRGTLAAARRSVLPSAATAKRTKAAQSLDEQLAARARKFIAQRRIEKNGNKPAAYAALARRRGVSVAGDASRAPADASAASQSDWQEVVHAESGQTYYYNPTSGETSWDRPY